MHNLLTAVTILTVIVVSTTAQQERPIQSTVGVSPNAALSRVSGRGAPQAVKAFPTAEGFGANSVGGRGGRVVEVTNLNDSGEGSLRSAMEATGPRICVFRVSGTITLKSAIRVRTPYLTVAGQTSPGGVQIKGNGQPEGDWGVWFINGAHDIIVRHLRVRMGGNMKHDAGNNLLCYGTAEPGVHDVIFDHCSVSWGSDTQLDWYGSYLDRATFQWNIVAECFMGQHIGGNRAPRNITLHHNLYANLGSRTPLMQHASVFDFRNDIIVRGGSPLENLYVVDNIEIPNINNFASFASSGGTVSMLDAALIQDVNFMSGGYPAPYINRLSSVLQVTEREGSRDGFRGRVTLGFAGAGGILEGPIKKGRGSWVVSARRSFLDLFTDDIGFGGVPVNYSYNAKVLYDMSPRDRIWVANISGVDSVGIRPDGKKANQQTNRYIIDYDGWRTATGFNWQRLFGGRGVGLLGLTHSEASVASRIGNVLEKDKTIYTDNNREGESTVKYDLTLQTPFLGKVQAGGSYKIFRVDYRIAQPFGFDNPLDPAPGANPFLLAKNFLAYQSGAYFQSTRNLTGRLSLTWGGRWDNYQYISAHRFSPRVGVSYRITNRLSAHGSYGLYYQQPFFLFLSNFPENRDLLPARAQHFVAGVSYVLSPSLRMTIEGYEKDYRDYAVALEYPTFTLANAGDTFGIQNYMFPLTSAGRGKARGIELFVEKKFTDKWFGQFNVSYARSRHAALDGVYRRGSFDSPLIGNAVGGYRFNRKWDASARIVFYDGRPYTPMNGALSLAQNRAVVDTARANALRAPDYFRFDFRVDRTFVLRDKPLLVFAGLQNATNRKNFAGVSWNLYERMAQVRNQLGVFPLIGLDWRF